MEHKFSPELENTEEQHEEVEKIKMTSEADHYLEKLRQKDSDKKERAFETKNGIKSEKKESATRTKTKKEYKQPEIEKGLIEELKMSLHEHMKKDSTLDVPQKKEDSALALEVSKAKERKLVPSRFSMLHFVGNNTKKVERMAKRLFKRSKTFGLSLVFGVGSLFATQKTNATEIPGDSLGKKNIEVKKTYDEQLTPQIKQDWNIFLDFVKEKGYEGSKELDKDQSIGKHLMEEFRATHAETSLTYDAVKLIQAEMQRVKESAQALDKRQGNPNAEKTMAGVSKIDGWFGSHTSTYRFPKVTMVYPGGIKKDLGLVGGDLTADQTRELQKKLPPGVKIEKINDGEYAYEDPNSGDMIHIPPGWIK